MLAQDLGYGDITKIAGLLTAVSRMLEPTPRPIRLLAAQS
jgi:hypothetical protein